MLGVHEASGAASGLLRLVVAVFFPLFVFLYHFHALCCYCVCCKCLLRVLEAGDADLTERSDH